MDDSAERVDILLFRLRLVRSRSEARDACITGAITVNGSQARPSTTVRPGGKIGINYRHRQLDIELIEMPPRNASRANAQLLYRVINDTPTASIDDLF